MSTILTHIRRTLLGALLLAVTSPALAAERLAVLELSGTLTPDELGMLSDTVRGAVVGALGSEVKVMTRENMEVMLTDMGLDATCVAEGACEVETARNLGVDYVISGRVVGMGDLLVTSLKLHATDDGTLLGSVQVEGDGPVGLLRGLGEPASTLVGKLSTPKPAQRPPAGVAEPPAAVPKPAPRQVPGPGKIVPLVGAEGVLLTDRVEDVLAAPGCTNECRDRAATKEQIWAVAMTWGRVSFKEDGRIDSIRIEDQTLTTPEGLGWSHDKDLWKAAYGEPNDKIRSRTQPWAVWGWNDRHLVVTFERKTGLPRSISLYPADQ